MHHHEVTKMWWRHEQQEQHKQRAAPRHHQQNGAKQDYTQKEQTILHENIQGAPDPGVPKWLNAFILYANFVPINDVGKEKKASKTAI